MEVGSDSRGVTTTLVRLSCRKSSASHDRLVLGGMIAFTTEAVEAVTFVMSDHNNWVCQ